MQKLIQQQERNACARLKKKTAEWKFLNLEISIFLISAKSTPQNFFLFSLFLLLYVIKRFLSKKYGVTGLVFKIDAINSKTWVKFVAMQQDSATLIYDLNAMKGTTKSYLKKIEQAFKTEYFQA